MKLRHNTQKYIMQRLLWGSLALLAASLAFAQVPSGQNSPEPLQLASGLDTAQDDEPASQARGNSPSADATADNSIPFQSLTGALEILVHPVYPPEQARLVYQPLLDYLDDVTGLELTLAVERNFHRYWRNARRNEAPALILEDAHMAAWRMDNFGYQPLVTTAEPTSFSLLTTGAMADDSLDDFVSRRISSLPSPSLGYLVLARWYRNPLQQPRIQSTATSWLGAVEMVFSAEADAAIAPDNLVARYPNLYPVETSTELPGLTLSAAPDVPDNVRQALIDAMNALHENEDHHAALFELDIDRFVTADPEAYEGLESWLSTIFSF